MKELGSYAIDYEPYFDRWNCVLYYPNPALRGSDRVDEMEGSFPAFQHKSCLGVIRASDRKPPQVCPCCQLDTAREAALNNDCRAELLQQFKAVINSGTFA